MQIHKGFDSFPRNINTTITTGTFDGVHLGHNKILDQLVSIGQKTQTETVLFTFVSHPRIVLFPDNDLKLINSLEENINRLRSYNITHLILQEFNKEFSRISSLEYIRDVLINKLGMTNMVIGFNHHFGRNREGSIADLSEYADLYNFNIHQVEANIVNQKSISSTKIRDAINKGEMALANQYLGYVFSFKALVVQGAGRGRMIGFPTANLLLNQKYKITPMKGVYAVKVLYNNNTYQGMMNIGTNPTFNLKNSSIEVNIFDFSLNIYNQIVEVQVLKRIRNEKKFQSVDELKRQLSLDKISALNC